jgi:hypothetical protein
MKKSVVMYMISVRLSDTEIKRIIISRQYKLF